MEKKIDLPTLEQTFELMTSNDYKKRFAAEYYQLANRFYGLKTMLDKWDKNELDFEPTSPRSLYNLQTKAMAEYLAALEARAAVEQIEL